VTLSSLQGTPIRLLYIVLISLLPLSAAAAPVQDDGTRETPLVYRLSIPAPASHRLHVQIVEDHPAARVEFAIPAWTPGFYQILNYEKDIEQVRASDAQGNALPVTHPGPRLWSVDTAGAGVAATRVLLDYDIDAHDIGLGFFGSTLDSELQRGYINGASAFLYAVGSTQRPILLDTTMPKGWEIATALTPAVAGSATSHGSRSAVRRFEAESYDALIDSPLQLGKFATTEFASDGSVFQCVCVGSPDWDRPKVSAVLTRIVHAAISIFGKPPFKRYVFFYHVGGAGFEGGLEHRNSTVIHLGHALQNGKGEEFQSVTAHEFFHTWNVKRLRPAGLGPFDYTQPVRTASLWWAEGVTDYYADVVLYRCGLRDSSWLLNDLAERIGELDNNPARLRVSLEDAGRKAWEGESEGFDGLSYYLKGSLVGLYFDLRLRQLTAGQRSLDDVMRLLDAEYGGKNRSYPETALLSSLEAVAHTDLHSEYAVLTRAPGDIPWDTVLVSAGLALRRDETSFLGVQLRQAPAEGSGIGIEAVEPGSAAARIPLRRGDSLLALNGVQVTLDGFKNQLGQLAPKSPITLSVRRDGETQTLTGDSGVRYSRYRLIAAPGAARVGVPAATLFLPIATENPAVPRP
jgi:predicted metalloprotease with PDZ domain